ncbi:MAG TPA: nucleotidyltransferase family protein [Longimicrobium sp.]|nr:nucleotidyltransferase family protein [Longimicrobium sp.]
MPASRRAPFRGFRLGEALALRGWALRLLAGAAAMPPPEAGAGSWAVFAHTERCAHPLLQALARARIALPVPAERVLRAYADTELKRILSAAAQLHALRGVARETGWTVVVMKGGVLATTPARAVDVLDLDVLLLPAEARALAARLDATLGYVTLEADPDPRAGMAHLAQRIAPHHVQVEIHERVSGLAEPAALLARVEPLEGAPGLFRLHAGDHLRHLLEHGVRDHPDRRGSLRDLLLVADAVRRAPDVPAEAWGGGAQAERNVLAMARALAEGDAPPDAFAAEAAARYLVLGYVSNWLAPTKFTRDLGGALAAMVSHPREYAWLWGRTLGRPLGAASSYRSPLLRRAALVAAPLLRSTRLLAASVAAVPFVPWARAAASPRR